MSKYLVGDAAGVVFAVLDLFFRRGLLGRCFGLLLTHALEHSWGC